MKESYFIAFHLAPIGEEEIHEVTAVLCSGWLNRSIRSSRPEWPSVAARGSRSR